MTITNWAGSHRYRAEEILEPRSVDELVGLLDGAPIKVIGTRHTFSDIGDAERLVSLHGLGEHFEVAPDRRTVRIDGAMTYGRLCALLAPEGLALANLASLPHISVAGAVATATHGSGLGNGNLATSVRSLSIATAAGIETFAVGDHDFPGAVVSLGALGPVVELVLAVEPAFEVAQTVHLGLGWDEFLADPMRVLGSAYSVSVFTRFGAEPGSVWIKQRIGDDAEAAPLSTLIPATTAQHPIPDHPADACTEQLGVPGSWSDRLPHFRHDFTPSSGEEIQSEYFVPIDQAAAAIDAVRSIAAVIAPLLLVAEIRTVAGDGLWLSPQGDGPTLALHFTWRRDLERATDAALAVERALAPFRPRPHWGKHFSREIDVGSSYRHRAGFLALRDRVDPSGMFINPWFERTLLD